MSAVNGNTKKYCMDLTLGCFWVEPLRRDHLISDQRTS